MKTVEVIAELGWNFLGDMKLAERMISAAAIAGADYAKFQTWKVNKLKAGPWDTDGRREIYEKAELSDDNHYVLKEACNKHGIKFLTSCFCVEDLDFIRKLSNEVKIASTECTNKELVESAIDKFDRVFISVGAATSDEYRKLSMYNNVTLLHCVSSYPCPATNVNLAKLRYIMQTCRCPVGYSGHYQGVEDAIAAVCLGATIIEKHMTTDRELPGRDNKFALYPEQIKEIVEFIKIYEQMNIDLGINYQDSEEEARKLYARRWG